MILKKINGQEHFMLVADESAEMTKKLQKKWVKIANYWSTKETH